MHGLFPLNWNTRFSSTPLHTNGTIYCCFFIVAVVVQFFAPTEIEIPYIRNWSDKQTHSTHNTHTHMHTFGNSIQLSADSTKWTLAMCAYMYISINIYWKHPNSIHREKHEIKRMLCSLKKEIMTHATPNISLSYCSHSLKVSSYITNYGNDISKSH